MESPGKRDRSRKGKSGLGGRHGLIRTVPLYLITSKAVSTWCKGPFFVAAFSPRT